MRRKLGSSDGRTSRRSFLGLLGVAAGASALPAMRGSAASGEQFTITQGDQCVPVTPLSYEDASVTEFYGYSQDDYESHTKTGLEASDVSQLFLYQGPDGTLSLGIIHDVAEGSEGTGGAASFSFEGLAADGEWTVRNDDYDGANEIWDVSSSHESDAVHWAWNKWHSDGGVFAGLGSDFELTIDPAFNGEAQLDPGTPGEISEWQFVSGDPENPDRISLDLSEPLTIGTGSCGASAPSKVSAELDVKPGAGAVVNPRSHGKLPVALLSSESFDATTVDPESIRFGPGNATPVKVQETDVDGDGRVDLLMHFEMDATGIVVNTTTVTLNAETADGTRVYGSDRLDIVANRDDDEEKREHEGDHEETETKESEKETDRDDDDETKRESSDDETEREHGEETAEEARETAEEKREKAKEKREEAEKRAEEKREKAEEKREKKEEKREEKEEEKRGKSEGKGKGRGSDDDDDEDETESGSLIGLGGLLG